MNEKNEKEKNHIREIQEQEYSMEMNEDYIREIQEQKYSMEKNNENEEEKNYIRKILEQVYSMEMNERKEYKNKKAKYEINKIYRKCGLKNRKAGISLIEIEKLVNDMNKFNYENEKNEYLFKMDLKDDMINNFKFKDLERVEKICENLSKNDFTVPKYKYKKDIAKHIRKLYREYKWLRTSHFKFLITENFKKFEEIKKLKLNRNIIVLCYNEVNKIVCVYFFYLINNYITYLIDLLTNDIYYPNDDFNSRLFEDILKEKEYQDYMGGRREKKIIEERI